MQMMKAKDVKERTSHPGDVAMQAARTPEVSYVQECTDGEGLPFLRVGTNAGAESFTGPGRRVVQVLVDRIAQLEAAQSHDEATAWQKGCEYMRGGAAAVLVDRDWFSHEEGDAPLECKYGKQIGALPIPPAPQGRVG